MTQSRRAEANVDLVTGSRDPWPGFVTKGREVAMTYRCSVCGKEYQSRSGLRRHVKAKHRVPVPTLPIEGLEAAAASEAADPAEGPAAERSEAPPPVEPPEGHALADVPEVWAADEIDEVERACDALGIDVDDVLAYKVYHEPYKVVIIEGPVGYKRVWCGG